MALRLPWLMTVRCGGALALWLAACTEVNPIALPADAGCTAQRMLRLGQNFNDKVDLLFVVDDTASMAALQERLGAGWKEFVGVFQDLNQRGVSSDLHIGVITTDYGAGKTGDAHLGCAISPGGKLGQLQWREMLR